MKVLPSLSQATSVTWRNRPSSAGSGGLGCFSGAKIWPLELTETPETSPKYMLCGRRSGLGAESKGMLGTDCCAKVGDAINSNNAVSQRFIISSQTLVLRF